MQLKWIVAAGLVSVLGSSKLLAQSPGEHLYRSHCASCHGFAARGQGAEAATFAEPPRDLREGFLDKYSTEELVQRILDGRELTLALDPAKLRERTQDVEAIVAHLQSLPKVDWRLVEQGRQMYTQRCVQCHGVTGEPPQQLPAGVRRPVDLGSPAFQGRVADAQLEELVRHGRRGMPALTPRLPLSDVRPLVALVRLFSPGYRSYDRYCAACHGTDGRGAGSFGESLQLPTVNFDKGYFARRDGEYIRQSAWHMLAEQKPAMPHYQGVLDRAQATAIVEYLKQLR